MPFIEVPEKIQRMMEIMEASGHEVCAVGGCVRDSLLGRPIHDWDLCTSAQPGETEETFAQAGLETIPTGKKHGTITVLWNKEPVEITTYRIDGAYTDSRRPDSVTFTRRLEEDLSRRDFTINAMACGRDGQVIDLFGGQRDLAEKRIRCVGDPRLRFEEDALRILRALRFAARLDFRLEEKTAEAVTEERGRLSLISPERIWSELCGLLSGGYAGAMVREFYPVLSAALGIEPGDRESWTAASEGFETPRPDDWSDWAFMTARFALLLWKGALSGGSGGGERARELCVALRTDKASRSRVSLLVEQAAEQLPQTTPQLRRRMADFGPEAVSQLIFLWEAGRVVTPEAAAWLRAQEKEILRRGDCIGIGQLAVGGKELQEAGISAGPQVGWILRGMLDAVMEETVPNEREALLQWAARKYQ